MAKSKKARPIWTADAETDPFKRGRVPAPFVWGLYKGDGDYTEFDTIDEFIAHVSQHECIIYAHNGGKFDWHFLLDKIPAWEPITMIAGRLARFAIGKAEFRDSFNIIPAPLSAYQKDEINYDIFEASVRNEPHNRQVIRAYLKSDCVYLHEMVTAFIDEYGLQLTQASAAIRFWSKLTGTKIPQTNKLYYDDLAPFYYGGRVQCFQAGIINEPFDVIDIRSAYPRAMEDYHPWGQRFDHWGADGLEGYNDDEISRSFIHLSALSTGVFPFRGDEGLDFPDDLQRREFKITGWEYLAARDTGYLKEEKIISVRHFHRKIEFRQYVRHFFAMKDEADRMMKEVGEKSNMYGYWASRRLFAKIFLNALYGKWCANPENYEEFMTLPEAHMQAAQEEDGWRMCGHINAENILVSRPLPEKNHKYYDISVGASVTGWVRAFLWRSICLTKGTMIYCDTDSIAAHDVSQVEIGPELGQWENEGHFDFAAIGGKKLYAFRYAKGEKKAGKYKTATKGVRLSPQEIIDIAKGHQITFSPEVPTFSVKTGIKFTPRRVKMLDREKKLMQKNDTKRGGKN